MGDIAKQFVKNDYGVTIVKCCASCLHHVSDGRDKIRICRKEHRGHWMDYLCKNGWEMDKGLENAGKGNGRVKKREYIQYILENGLHHADDFEKQFGSKYLTKK